ncbi:Crp/Fnr family transcriptional regulator [Desulfovibrio ferrophilus]|uniref:Transcriptional regulator, Crp/Fnr family n=1 Tax=Desulfovibrio ferrophilus TaxID=241368 RepID=A0A2Z6B3N7_9BACT|nr:Crp/Fnr family transcriptional regulator [Desulfovibrio ferrophilus]BBD10101.1 transcriptional regulator, Crp/Fnr family [Desulfovibrio ferrophilus]
MTTNITTFLGTLPLFTGLSADQLEAINNIGIVSHYPKGKTIFTEGSEATGFHVAVSGQVKIFKLSLDGREQIIHIYGPGEPFGEVPMFEGGRLPAHAEATMDSDVLFLPRNGLTRLIERDKTLALNMLAALSMKLRRFTIKLENLTLKETPQRVAAYLLDLSDRAGGSAEVTLDVTKGHLAGLLGTAQETLSRVLKKLKEAGLIEVSGKHITLLDTEGLQDVSDGERRV